MGPKAKKNVDVHHHLVARCRQGERKAQFELYDLYSKAMYNTALRITGTGHEAEEVMQEAFITAFEKLHLFRGDVSFGSWLRRIVINKALDHLRKRKVRWEELDENMTDETSEEKFSDPDREENLQPYVEKIRSAMGRLTEGYRTILSLYLFEGYDHEEIAGILGISHVTSRTQYLRAKRKLKELLHELRDGQT